MEPCMYMRILVHNARQGSSTILPRPSLIYSPSEVDDFRYFSSAVSSKQLPFPNVHPARPAVSVLSNVLYSFYSNIH